jgi:hypothetical protein
MNELFCGKYMKGSSLGVDNLLSLHLPRVTEENHERLSQDHRSPGRDLKPGLPNYEAGVLTTLP